jgi:hypothetical protein
MIKSQQIAIKILFIWVLISCGKEEPGAEQLETAKITIYDANSWTSESNDLEIVVGAQIKLYKDENTFNSGRPDYEAITDENGVGTVMVPTPVDVSGDGFYDENNPHFIIIIEKDGKSNLNGGFAIAGVFFCQSEFKEDFQSGATVGGIKYSDVNGDGVIDSMDKVPYGYITLTLEGTDDNGQIVIAPEPFGPNTSCSNKPSDKNVGYIGQ